MEVFAPDNLTGVGVGSIASISAILGLIGLALTSGMLVGQGLLGTSIFCLSIFITLSQTTDFAGSLEILIAVLGVLAIMVFINTRLLDKAQKLEKSTVGLAKDSAEVKAAQSSAKKHNSRAQFLAFLSVVFSGIIIGFLWAEWNEMPFTFIDQEAVIGIVSAVIIAAIGGDVAWNFIQGSIRAGGSPKIISAFVCIIAAVFAVASIYIPFLGVIILGFALFMGMRLRRRKQQKHGGLRILS